MQILIKLKDDSKFNAVSSSIGTFRKGTVYAIDSSHFDESIMDRVDKEEKDVEVKVPLQIIEPKLTEKKEDINKTKTPVVDVKKGIQKKESTTTQINAKNIPKKQA